MIKNTFITAGALILIGLVGFLAAADDGKSNITALIPAAFGIAFLMCGFIGLIPSTRKHVMHAAALLSLLGAFGAGMRIPKLMRVEEINLLAISSHIAMTVTCIIFLVLCIRSFIHARMAKK